MRDAPARHRRGRRGNRIGAVAGRTAQQQGGGAAVLGGELQPAGLRHLDALRLADHRAESAVTQTFLNQREQFGIVARLGIDDARRREPGLEQPRREQVARADDPQYLAAGTGGYSGCEQDRGGIVAPAGAARGDFMERIGPQPPIGEAIVEHGDAERQHGTVARLAGDGLQALAERG